MAENVAVLGASSNPDRYSYKAVKLLDEMGYNVLPVHPSARPIDGIRCYSSLKETGSQIDTVTVYLSERNSTPIVEEIIGSKPRRVILNPGAESEPLKVRCEAEGIIVQEACTLVLLRTGQF